MIDKVSVPPAAVGNWRIETFEVPDEPSIALFRLGARAPSPGTCTRLMRGRQLVMSDTNAEMRDHYEPVRRAKGHCLVNGLGLGMVANAMARKDGVDRVTVIERAPEVIELVAKTLDPKIEVINACAFTYRPPKSVRYGCVWHDIWDDICLDNLPEMTRLHRKYGRRCDWQGSWCRHTLERLRR